MIHPGEYDDRSMFLDRGTLWRPQRGAGEGVIGCTSRRRHRARREPA
jgi:hypothetical protein